MIGPHVPLDPRAIAEPMDDRGVDLLEALPDGERRYCEDERNAVDYSGKSGAIFEELEAQFVFVGGFTEAYAQYLLRDDVPKDTWSFESPLDVQAYCGFSCVPKKDASKQRKILMMCPANYIWADPHGRGDHGMHGGAALATMRVPTDQWGVAAFDGDNAFTRLRAPGWTAKWQACPPIRAAWVWPKLSQHLRDLVGLAGWVAPCCHRLAMGGPRSVHLLMTVNTAIIGRALLGVGARLADVSERAAASPPRQETGPEAESTDQEDVEGQEHRYDYDWIPQQSGCWAAEPRERGYSVSEWLEAVRQAKRENERVLVAMRLFAGRRRPADVLELVEQKAAEKGVRLLFLSADLLDDPRWDLASPSTFSSLMQLCEDGWVDIVPGGPPCSTWSRARYNRRRPGPPPVRSRKCPWGLPGLRAREATRVAESNALTLNMLAICAATSQSGGAYLVERPEDPGRDPFLSIWNTTEMIELERRRGAERACFDQRAMGCKSMKPTCIGGTLRGLSDLDGLRCDGSHHHETSEGKLADGTFRTSLLAQYPEGLCRRPGELVVETLIHFLETGGGGTGWRRPPETDRVVSAWGERGATRPAVAARNEDVLRGRGLMLDGPQQAFYLHVGDGLVMAGGKQSGPTASRTMRHLADALVTAGFVVDDRTEADAMTRQIVDSMGGDHQAACR